MQNNMTMKNTNNLSELYKGLIGVKSWLSRGFVLILALFTLAVGNVWADYSITNAQIYYDDSNSNYSSDVVIAFDKSGGFGIFAMGHIDHTKLHHWSGSWGDGGVTYMRFGKTTHTYNWYGHHDAINSTWAIATCDDNSKNWTYVTNGWGLSIENASKMFGAASNSQGANLTKTDLSGYSALNHSQTVYKYTSTDNGSSYSAASVNSGTVTISAYKMTGNGTASNTSNSATINTAATTSASKDAAYTGEVTLTASANTGYTFVGWFESASGGSALSTSAEYTYNAPNATKSIYARFRRNTYTITYNNMDGATNHASNPSSYTIESPAITLQTPTKTGYLFGGWYTDSGLNTPVGTPAIAAGSTGNKTFYAKWTEITITELSASPSSGTTGIKTMTVSFKTNVPRSAGYYYRIAEFGGAGTGTTGGGFHLNGQVINSGTAETLITTAEFSTISFGTSGIYTSAVEIYTDGPLTVQKRVTFTYGAGNYYTVSFNMNGHGSAISNQSVLSGSTATAPSPAPTATGYNFGGWYENEGCTGSAFNFSTAITANKPLYAKWTPKTTTVTLNQQSGTGGTANVTATYDAAMPAATMPTRDNYTFNGYFTGTEGSGTKYYNANGTSAKNWDIEDATKTLYASWTETKYDVTVSVSNPSAAAGTIACTAAGWVASNNGTAQIGNATDITITAGEAASGYTWGSWVLSGGVTLVSGALTNPSIIVKATAAGTATYTYAEDLSTSWYISGDGNGTGTDLTPGSPFSGWGTSGTRMYKKAGYSTVEKYYCNITVSTVATTNDHFPFQVFDGTNHRGYNGYWITKENNSTTVYTSNPTNMKFRPYLTGTYEFEVDNTGANPVLTVHWPVINQLRVSSADPTDATNTSNFDLADQGSNNWSVTRTLNANTTYTFKMVYDSEWYGDGSAFTRSKTSTTGLGNGANMTIKTDVAGEYTFTFNSSSKNLSITYPTAYTVTYGVGTSYTSMGSVSTSPDITSGNYVIAGTNITFTATPNLGYKFIGWYANAACTGEAVSTNASYNIASLGANTTLYAKFDYRDLYIHADWIGEWGTAKMTQSTTNRAVYTYEFDPLNAKTTAIGEPPIYNGGWHFQFVNTTVDPNNNRAYTYDGVQTPTGSGIISNDQIHKTAVGNPTIQFYLTQKSKITITLTLQSTNDATKPTVNIAADPYYTITYGAPTNGTYTIQVGAAAAVSTDTDARAATTISLANTPATGYHFGSWNVTKSPSGDVSVTSNQFTMPTANVNVAANFTPNTYTVQFHRNGGTGTPVSQDFTYDAAQNLTANTYTKTGYNFAGWALSTSGDVAYADAASVSNLTSVDGATFDLYAKWTPKTTTLTFSQSGTGYGSGAPASQTATYDAAMPTPISIPTAAAGYCFMGYYDALEPLGTQYYTSTGASARTWNKEDAAATLCAYFKQAEITNIELNSTVLDPVEAGGDGWVIANPTIEPTPAPTTIICWELLYDNNNPVEGHDADPYTESDTKLNQVRFSIAGLAAGSYKVKATLRAGGNCSAPVLDTREASFSIASDFTVTVQYKCGDVTIQSSTTSPGKPLVGTEITAPDIIGYTFSKWKAGDGVTIDGADASGEKATATINYTANYNGTLTAVYTKKNMIYFYNTVGWSDVWVYFYTSDKYWANDWGTGAWRGQYFNGSRPYYDMHRGQMTQIEGTNIWYFDYTAEGWDGWQNVAFTNMGDKSGQGVNPNDAAPDNDHAYFSNTTSNPIQVIRRGDHKTSLPMFVPLTNQTKQKKNNNKAEYYSDGYWMNYPENTGYTLKLYSSQDATTPTRTIRFPFSADTKMPLKLDVELNEAATNYFYTIYREDGAVLSASYGMNTNYHSDVRLNNPNTKISIKTTAPGIYTFTLVYKNTPNLDYYISVDYPIGKDDYRVWYSDNAKWSQSSAHAAGWYHPSDVIRRNTDAEVTQYDTVSFFVAKGEGITTSMKFQYASAVGADGKITWANVDGGAITIPSSVVTEPGVYNFIIKQVGTADPEVEKVEPYTGNYYIRTDNAGSTKWDYYRSQDHQMTYSSFSESAENSFGEKFSHYYTHWCPAGTNVKFCIANDYSMCITDTLEKDVNEPYKNIATGGNLLSDGNGDATVNRYSANIRFMWDRKTNKISRAYVASSTNPDRLFLVLHADQTLKHDDNTDISSSSPLPSNSLLLSDKENWIYETSIKIKPGTRFKLFASYALVTPNNMDSVQFFRGAYDSGKFTSDANSVVLIGGESEDYQLARIVYDFKTNRLIAAWLPSGEISEVNAINADVMIIREHQESARCITFANSSANLSGVKTVYGVMKFNRWILNNRGGSADEDKNHARPDYIAEDLANYHAPLTIENQKSTYERRLYFISFPFNVRVGDIFGFGQYGSYWVLQYYDGLSRAKNGYWLDSRPNWKYISPTQVANGYTLEANQGYILELNLSAMAADNTTFWSNGISTIELYFPSTVAQETLKQTNCTIPALPDDYKCNINRGTAEGDRRVKDSYWRCIGVPSYNLYNSALKDGSGNTIEWKTDYTWQEDESEFPFIYMWNKTDNTLTPQSTSAFLFQPMHAYLTQIKSAIVWTAVSAKPSSIVARRARKEADNEHEWRIELRQDTTFLDQTYVRMTNLEQVTDSFDFGQDLVKELNSRSNIYTFIGYEKVAANSMTVHTDQTTVIPVGANIRADGEYTFAMPEGTNGVGITLIDTEANVRTSLSALDYTVTLSAGEYTNRFFLEISPVQNTPTDLGNVQGDNVQGTKARKVMVDGILYIVRDGKMYDARGARVE